MTKNQKFKAFLASYFFVLPFKLKYVNFDKFSGIKLKSAKKNDLFALFISAWLILFY